MIRKYTENHKTSNAKRQSSDLYFDSIEPNWIQVGWIESLEAIESIDAIESIEAHSMALGTAAAPAPRWIESIESKLLNRKNQLNRSRRCAERHYRIGCRTESIESNTYICIYIYIHIHIHTYINIHIILINTNIYICIYLFTIYRGIHFYK